MPDIEKQIALLSGKRALAEAAVLWSRRETQFDDARRWAVVAHARRRLGVEKLEAGSTAMGEHLLRMATVAEAMVATCLQLAEDLFEEARAMEIRSRICYEEAEERHAVATAAVR